MRLSIARSTPRYVLVAALIGGLTVSNIWLFLKNMETKEMAARSEKLVVATNVERDALTAELTLIKKDFENSKLENTSLASRLKDKDIEIQQKVKQIQQLIESGTVGGLRKAREEMDELKKLNENYTHTIEQLKSTNTQLQQVNQTLKVSVDKEKEVNNNLVLINTVLSSKLAAGSILSIRDLSFIGVRVRSSGKMQSTNKAVASDKIKMSFSILENLFAEPGPVLLHLRLIAPDGKLLSNNFDSFMCQGQELSYTMKHQIDYKNKEMNIELFWAGVTPLIPGEYKLEVYAENRLLGTQQLEMK